MLVTSKQKIATSRLFLRNFFFVQPLSLLCLSTLFWVEKFYLEFCFSLVQLWRNRFSKTNLYSLFLAIRCFFLVDFFESKTKYCSGVSKFSNYQLGYNLALLCEWKFIGSCLWHVQLGEAQCCFKTRCDRAHFEIQLWSQIFFSSCKTVRVGEKIFFSAH